MQVKLEEGQKNQITMQTNRFNRLSKRQSL